MASDASVHAFNPKILREYDIRGTVGKTLSADDALLLGQRFGQMMQKQGLKTVSVGRDGRLSSPALVTALIEGLIETGAHVHDIGIGPTPMLYFSVKHLKTDAGIMVTGSHNPPQDNGFKMTLANRPFFGANIQNLAVNEPCTDYPRGLSERVSVHSAYIERLLQDYKPGRRLKVAWDPGNGAAGEIVQALIDSGRLAVDSIAINTNIDGTFPAHHPDPTVEKNLKDLAAKVKETGAIVDPRHVSLEQQVQVRLGIGHQRGWHFAKQHFGPGGGHQLVGIEQQQGRAGRHRGINRRLLPFGNRQQVLHGQVRAAFLAIGPAIFRHPDRAQLAGKLVRQHRLAGAFRAVEADLDHAAAPLRPASTHSFSPTRLITSIPP